MATVRFQNVTKTFGSVVAVKNLSLQIQDREFMVFVGPSGCGKTTALRMLAGLEEADTGEIYVDDRKVNDVNPKDRDVAMVFQNYALYPHLSVYDNIAFGLHMRELKGTLWQLSHYDEAQNIRQRIKERVHAAAEMLGIVELLSRKPKELSGGQRQRVALARAIVRKPKVFLMDEPLSNLDAKLRDQTRAELKKLQESLGVTTLYVTHDQKEAMTLGTRIAIMNQGVLQQVGTPEEVYYAPANLFVAGFIGSPPMNFFAASVQEERGQLIVHVNGIHLPLNEQQSEAARAYIGKPILLGVRPQDIYIHSAMPEDITPSPSFQAAVDVIEPHGDRTDLHMTSKGVAFTAQLRSNRRFREDETLQMVFNMNPLHLFDRENGQAIGRP
jgi:multiple sugar transport system ATP-binding protein